MSTPNSPSISSPSSPTSLHSPRKYIGDDLQVALAGDLQPRQPPGVGQSQDVELPAQRRPIGHLVAPRDVALEIRAPALHVLAGEANGLERDAELGAPAERRPILGLDVPDPVPVDVEAAAGPARSSRPSCPCPARPCSVARRTACPWDWCRTGSRSARRGRCPG